MESSLKESVDKYYHILLDRLNVSVELVSCLYEKGVLDDTTKDEILCITNARQCRKKLLDFLLKGDTTSKGPFVAFLEALSNSEQQELAKSIEDSSSSQLEEERARLEWHIKLRKFHQELVTRLQVRAEFLATFVAESVLTLEEQELIECEITDVRKAAKFLSILHCKPSRAIAFLLQCLRGDDQSEDLAEKIENVPLTDEDWNHHYGEIERENIRDMLQMGFEVRMDGKVSLKKVVRHLEIRFKKNNQRVKLEAADVKKHLTRVFNGIRIDTLTAAQRKKKKQEVMVHNLITTSGYESEEAQEENISAHDAERRCSMATWGTEKVVEWLEEEDTDPKTVKLIQNQGLTGRELMLITVEALNEIVPKKAKCVCIITERDEFIERERESKKAQAPDSHTDEQTSLVEPYRKFDRPVEVTDSYQQYSHFPNAPSRPTNLIEPVRRFVQIDAVDNDGPEFQNFASEVVAFGAACLNDCTNGVIHFGVNDLRIVGVTVKCDEILLDKCLTREIKRSFHESQIDRVLKCVRPIRFVRVISKECIEPVYILEIDVEPLAELCGDDVYFVHVSNELYTFDENLPCMVRRDKYPMFFRGKDKLAKTRKWREKESCKIRREPPRVHKDNLVNVLCQGKSKLREGQHPILVLPPTDPNLVPAEIEGRFSFLTYVKWKAVFDFGSDRSFLNFLKQYRFFKIRDVEDFDNEKMDKPGLRGTNEDAYNSQVPNWILMNGDLGTDSKPKNLAQWKRDTEDVCRGWFKTYTKGFNSTRVLFVFLLHSKSSDVFIDACAQLCVHSENFACIAEDESIAKTWQAGMMKYDYIRKEVLEQKVVAGMTWDYVGEIFDEITTRELKTKSDVPTSNGPKELTIKKELFDLSVLASNECMNTEIAKDPTKPEHAEFLRKKEVEFYKGGEVSWWNFWDDAVCHRDVISALCEKVSDALKDAVEGEAEQGIKTLHLYHQPGSGGTTCARQVLWQFRDKVKCAQIVSITDNTALQVAKLRDFGEQHPEYSDPVLLLIDNKDEEKTFEFLMRLRRISRTRSRNVENVEKPNTAYCVCLIVNRRSNLQMPKNKHDTFDCVQQKLSGQEQASFQKQSERLQEKHACHTLIAFNIMKENFNATFIAETVSSLIQDIKDDRELFLLKFLAFVNFYDIFQTDVECSAFQEVMGADLNPYWEEELSDALNVLVVQEISDSGHRVIKISHFRLSEEIIKVLNEKTLSEFALDLVGHSFLKSKRSIATVHLKRLIAEIVKLRDRDENGYRKLFAPLVLQIKREESWTKAADVMKYVYDLTDDPFVAQQLARLHIDAESWDSAILYASQATARHPDKYQLLDTQGQVFRHRLEKHYSGAVKVKHHTAVKVEQALKLVEYAKEAADIFKKSIALCNNAYSNMLAAKPTISGELGILQTYASLLENLSLVPVFSNAPYRRKVSPVLHQFLLDPSEVPQQLKTWPQDLVDFLKSIPENAKENIRSIEDFLTHVNKRFVKSKDADYDLEISRQKTTMHILKNRLFKFILSFHNFTGSTASNCETRNDEIWLLGGTSFNNILDTLSKQKCSTSIGDDNSPDDQSEIDPSCEDLKKLQELLQHSKECLRENPHQYEALECSISVALIVSCFFEQTPLAQMISYQDVLDYSRKLYAIRNSKPKRVEPYMYYVMFHWPNGSDPQETKSITDAMAFWSETYQQKNPNMLANHDFYFSQGTQLQSLVHRSKLFRKKHRGDLFWKDEDVIRVVRRFAGTLDGKGTVVYLRNSETKDFIMTIPLSHPVDDSSLYWNSVTFVIALTYMGPKAFDVQRE